MKKVAKAIIAFGILAMTATGCANREKGDRSVPRREGYPRIEAQMPVYAKAEGLPVSMEVNTQAQQTLRSTLDGSIWLDCLYPQLRATTYFTFTPVNGTTLPDVISNRLDRILLNLGGIESQIEEFESIGGVPVTLFTSEGVIATPIQFVATFPAWVISGSVFLADLEPNAPMDSIAPIIDLLRNDVSHSLFSLQQ